MSTIDFRKYLNAAGLGESAPVRRRRANIKPKAFNPMAFAESYKFIAEDGKRMALSNNRLNKELRGIAAKGEAGAEEFKEKFKEGMSKVKKVLIELYDKIIRFFTETVRYWMSNERKIAKVIANLKNAKKVSGKKDKFSVPVSTYGAAKGGRSESFRSFGEAEAGDDDQDRGLSPDYLISKQQQVVDEVMKTNGNVIKQAQNWKKVAKENEAKYGQAASKLRTATNKIAELERALEETAKTITSMATETKGLDLSPAASISSICKVNGVRFTALIDTLSNVGATKDSNLDEIKELCSDMLDGFRTTNKEVMEKLTIAEGGTVTIDRANYEELVDLYISTLSEMKGGSFGMNSLNKNIRQYTNELRALKESFKKEENPSEEQTLKYQAKRVAIQTQTTATNLFIGFNDKIIGIVVKLGGKVASAA